MDYNDAGPPWSLRSDYKTMILRRAYASSITRTDAEVGRVLAAAAILAIAVFLRDSTVHSLLAVACSVFAFARPGRIVRSCAIRSIGSFTFVFPAFVSRLSIPNYLESRSFSFFNSFFLSAKPVLLAFVVNSLPIV